MMHQPQASYRLDKQTLAEEESGPAPDAGSPPEGWLSLPDCRFSTEAGPAIPVPLVLLHAEFGVALLGVPGAVAPAATAALRQRLEAARFSSIFAGHLPVVALAILPGEPLNLQRRLAAAFAAEPPLALAGGDGWVNVVRRALLVRAPGHGGGSPAQPLKPTPPMPARAARRRQPGWVWPMVGLTGAAALVGLVVGLNHAPADRGSGAEVTPQPVASEPAQPVARSETAAVQPLPPPASPPQPAPVAATIPAPSPAVSSPLPRVLVRSAANLRAGPDGQSAVLRTAPRGEAFRVHGEVRGGWVQVGDATPEGWIHSSLLSDLPP